MGDGFSFVKDNHKTFLSLLKKIRNFPQRDFSFAEVMLSFLFGWFCK